MSKIYDPALMDMGMSLATLAVKGTVTAVNSKIQSMQSEKNLEKVRNAYDEIINGLLSEREEAIRIAQAYKTELDRIVISDEDIQHLHNTVSRIIEIVKSYQLLSAMSKGDDEVKKVKKQVENYEQLKELISVDTLKTMQLLGFNYKAAIGDPLTQICANAIISLGGKKNNNANKRK